ncbi:transcription initiation factor TFIID component TAF4 family-domain-containing protein [Crepidotus variabilis]|uniref:Transcription initiation factor TFIID subunit 4 n=1 Tax=Crepidotus variabilis TaxID=179855 RepID=A0A9P6EU79_9AGAR|nr:transcription initiation factor TFIID component TAF4 family-domain-containing protein [Crepidotus variabilis]
MKQEDSQPATTTPAPSQPATPAPTTAQTAYTQWATTRTSQFYSPYTSHYPQAAYATHYQAYAPPVAAAQNAASGAKQPVTPYQTSTYSLGTTSTANTATASGAGTTAASGTNNAMDTSDIATLNDALGSAGVDLRAEEESLQTASLNHSYLPRSYEDRTRKQPLRGPAVSTIHLTPTVRTIASSHKITRIPDESVNYLALCLRARLQELVEAMVKASRHRTDSTFERPARMYEGDPGATQEGETKLKPMWSILVRSDVAKQLAALEKVEREEETRIRKERKERAELQAAHAAALAAQASGLNSSSGDPNAGGGDMDEGLDGFGLSGAAGSAPKKKRKKEGPGVTARNMSEDVRKKMSNAVATQAAGLGGKYAWMNAGAGGAAAAKKAAATPAASLTAGATGSLAVPAVTTATPAAAQTATTTPSTSPSGAGSSTTASAAAAAAASTWARPYIPTTLPKSSYSGTPGGSGSAGNGGGGADSSGGDGGDDGEGKITITMHDAMFVVEKERGHGGGRGAARGWV